MPLLLYITVPDQTLAWSIATRLIETRLAAGANVAGPVESVYRWKGAIQKATEWQLFVQAADDDYGQIEQLISQHHPYEVPCIIAVPIERGLPPFLQWIERRGE